MNGTFNRRQRRREGRRKEECRMQNEAEGGARGYRGMRNTRSAEKRTKSDPVNQTKSDQKKRTSPDQGAGRWIKTGADEPRFGSSGLDAGKFRPDECESQMVE